VPNGTADDGSRTNLRIIVVVIKQIDYEKVINIPQ
jgi:hypothetical protein